MAPAKYLVQTLPWWSPAHPALVSLPCDPTRPLLLAELLRHTTVGGAVCAVFCVNATLGLCDWCPLRCASGEPCLVHSHSVSPTTSSEDFIQRSSWLIPCSGGILANLACSSSACSRNPVGWHSACCLKCFVLVFCCCYHKLSQTEWLSASLLSYSPEGLPRPKSRCWQGCVPVHQLYGRTRLLSHSGVGRLQLPVL